MPLPCDELDERLVPVEGVGDTAPGHELVEHAGRRLADRASLPLVGQVGHGVAGDPDPDRDLVAAGGVDVVGLGVERLTQPAPDGVLVVVQDDLLVQRLGGHPKNLFTCSTPSTNSSISAVVVYT